MDIRDVESEDFLHHFDLHKAPKWDIIRNEDDEDDSNSRQRRRCDREGDVHTLTRNSMAHGD